MIEKPPVLEQTQRKDVWQLLSQPDFEALFKKINAEYLYWDKVKYRIPSGVDPAVFWHAVKTKRNLTTQTLSFGSSMFKFSVTDRMQELLHSLDVSLRGNFGTAEFITEKEKKIYLINSIMEESIASSQMEGASTTRKVAKDMLRKQLKPQNKGQQMIANNYNTMRYLVENRAETLSIAVIKEIQHLITRQTLSDNAFAGAFRNADDIMVMDEINGEVAHTPTPYREIEKWLTDLCQFANNNDNGNFVHPIIKGIIIHFMLAYIHPFVDGNGRTARSLAYWHLIKQGYGLAEYLSISRIIYRSKKRYETALLYTENDENDISYFIQYNLETMHKALEELKIYLQREIGKKNDFSFFKDISEINARQAQLLKTVAENPRTIFTAKELIARFNVSVKTSRNDLQLLVKLGFMTEKPLNKRHIGYVKADDLDEKLAAMQQKQR